MRGLSAVFLVGLAGCSRVLGVGDPPGQCAAGCACQTDDECGAHEFCDNHVTSTSCECVAGYGRGTAGCAWQGVITDPGFAQATTWAATNSASFDPSASAGLIDPGVTHLGGQFPCSATVVQRVVMPRYARAEPLVAQIRYLAGDQASTPAFGIGTSWIEQDASLDGPHASWQITRVCLGAGQYADERSTGRGEELALTIGRQLACRTTASSFDVDHVEIVPAQTGECPLPGQVLNGLVDDDTGWQFSPASSGATATFAPGVGERQSRGIMLSVSHRCNSAEALVPASPGLVDVTGAPALSMFLKAAGAATAGTSVNATLDHDTFALPMVDALTAHLCVPAPLRGAGNHLKVSLHGAPFPLTLPCSATALSAPPTMTLDSVRLYSDPACGTDPAVANPGFEAGGMLLNASPPGDAGTSVLVAGAAASPAPHGGSQLLQLRVPACSLQTTFGVDVIAARDPIGHAFTFWYSGATTPGASVSALHGSSSGEFTPQATWQQGKLCLDAHLAGRSAPVAIRLASAPCPMDGAQLLQLDDLAVVDDPACPAASP